MEIKRSCGRIQLNSDKHSPAHIRGNAMIYILLALALLAGLTMVLNRGNDMGGDDLDKDKTELLTLQVTAYAGSAKNAVDQMMMSGTPVTSLNFVVPSDPTFNTGSNIHKVYHPAGGGLAFEKAEPAIFDTTSTYSTLGGWYMTRTNNIEWTPTAAPDVLLVAWRIHKAICENINKKITGSTDIPDIASPVEVFLGTTNGAPTNEDLMIADCADCEGYPALCVSNAAQNNFAYYNIISGQ